MDASAVIARPSVGALLMLPVMWLLAPAPLLWAAPTGSVVINGGAAITVSTTITLTLSASDPSGSITKMKCSNDGVTYSAQEAYATTKTWTLSVGEGTKTVYVQFRGANNVWSAPATDTIILDTTPPTVSVTSPAMGSTVAATIGIVASANDAGGVSGVQFTLDGANLGAEDLTSPYGVTWNTTSAANGSHTLTAVARDVAGRQTASSPITVTVNNAMADTTPPTGSITINGGAAATKTTTVTLTLSATDNAGTVSQMQFSDDGTTYSTPEAYTTTKAWPLPNDSDGLYTIFARFKDAAGNWSAATTDSITLDLTAPTLSAVSASGLTASAATITWTTNEASTTQVDYGPTTAYGQSSALNATLVTSHSVALSGLSASTLYHYRARSKDAVGNERLGMDATFTTVPSDTTPPTGSVTINGGAAATNSATVTLTLSATDNAGAVSQMQFSNDGTTYSAAEAYTTSKTWTLSSGDGTKTVYAKFKDAAGNWSVAATDTITLDTTTPTISAVSASGLTASGATITWTTSEPATSQVDYGTTTGYGQNSPLDSALLTNHGVALSGLSASTLYHYRVRSKDAAGNERLSADAAFTTSAPSDTTPPTGSVMINGGASSTNNPAVTLTLSATDNSGTVSQMRFSNDGTTYAAPETYATTKAWTLANGDGLKTVSVKFADAAGNWSAPATDTIELDTTPPVLDFTSPQDGAVINAPSP